jgi:hypothetical protein
MSNTNYIEEKINNDKRIRDMVVGQVVAHLCLTLIIKDLKFSVDHDRVVTTPNTIKHLISYLVYVAGFRITRILTDYICLKTSSALVHNIAQCGAWPFAQVSGWNVGFMGHFWPKDQVRSC